MAQCKIWSMVCFLLHIFGSEKAEGAGTILVKTVNKITDGSIVQCNQSRIKDCWKVELNLNQLESLKPGDSILFSDQTDFNLKLRQNPTTFSSGSKNYQFLIVESGQEASLTVKRRSPGDVSVFGVVRSPENTYTLEYCRDGCNVLYSVSANAFNDFID